MIKEEIILVYQKYFLDLVIFSITTGRGRDLINAEL
jgi:hypothetical protein